MLKRWFKRDLRLSVFDKEIAAFVRETEAAYPADGASHGAEAARAAYDKMCARFRAPRPTGMAVEDAALDGPAGPLKVRIYRPAGLKDDVRLLYFHGGGFVVGSLDSHDDVCAEFAAAAGRELVAVDYRLAPEHTHPAAHEDAAAAARWLAARGPYVALGDSVGGTITTALALEARGTDWAPAATVLIYPGLGGESLGLPAYREHADAPMLSVVELHACWAMRAGRPDYRGLMREDWRFAPFAAASLEGLPPTSVYSVSIDPLRDDGPAWVERLRGAGVEARLFMGGMLPHGALRARRRSKRAARFFEEICKEIKRLAEFASSSTKSAKSGIESDANRTLGSAHMSVADAKSTPQGTYSTYAELPPLPVPDFDTTMQRYLDSVEPLVPAAEFDAVKAAVAAFAAPDGLGRKLHAALVDKAAEKDNWLADWWDDVAYLAYPEPVLINSNFGISVDAGSAADDPATRAAEVAARTVDFVHQLWAETLPPETVGRNKAPIDMSLYRRIFGAARNPGLEKDEIAVHAHDQARHIFAMRKGRYFAIEALGPDGRKATVEDLRVAFQRIIDWTDASAAQEPVAVLTTERRPVWALERQRLLADPVNAATLEMIETAMFGMFFDEQPVASFNDIARSALMGQVGTRWMDKVFSYVVHPDGRISQHGEHSPADGMQFVTAFDYGCDAAAWRTMREEPAEKARSADTAEPKEHGFALTQDSRAAIKSAIAHFEAKTEDLDIEVLVFEEFGKELIKTLGTGPDSFVQMAYQLAYWRKHGRTPKTYESGQTRAFRIGRTETIRSVSVASRDFTALMDDAAAPAEKKVELLRAAFAAHGERGKLSAQAQGVDRHLLGMKLMAAEKGVTAGLELFDQEIWTRGWELSTAQLPMKALRVNGFGPVCWQGYGIGYVIRDDNVTCNISSWRSHPETGSKEFADAIAQAMRDMKGLLQA
ncbi:MAG: choline/carnitine O-acyltransferase [Neomegalonema sp.]|nr:choline/carnitine O-acyltransferase [Neomegalonema sp.]